jgi:hypothetical protein
MASGAGVLVTDLRVGCDAAHDTDTPICVVEVLGDLGTDVRRVGRLASGLWVDALKPGLVGVGGAASVVGGDAAGSPLVPLHEKNSYGTPVSLFFL